MKIINYYDMRNMNQAPDFRFTGHRHGRYEANILLKGEIELTCDDKVFLVSQGHFAIWKPGVFHMSRVVSPTGAELISMSFDLADDTLLSEGSAVFEMSGDDLMLSRLISTSSGDALTKLTEAFLIRLGDRKAKATVSKAELSGVYQNAVSFMSEKLGDDICVGDVAKHCGVCLTTLKKAFSRCAGKGVRAYFNDMRIHRAKEMLKKGFDVSEVSDSLGFSSPSYFSQCFKREVGISPKKY